MSHRSAFTWALLLLALSFIPSAQAESSDPRSLTALPWTGAFLNLREDNQEFAGSFSQRIKEAFILQVQAKAPLNQKSRVAAFASGGRAAAGISGVVSLEWNNSFRYLNPTGSVPTHRQQICDERGFGNDCTTQNLCKTFEIKSQDCNAAAVSARIDERFSEAPVTRRTREQLGFVRPVVKQASRLFSIGGELSGSFDRLSVYSSEDIAAGATEVSDWSATAGVLVRFTVLDSGFTMTLRPGLGAGASPTVSSKLRRCQSLPSSDPSVRAERCDDEALFLESAADTELTAYVRTAFTYALLDNATNGLVPGVEARINFENLTTDQPLAELKFEVFVAPVTGPLLVRSGVGFVLQDTLSGPDKPQTFSPYGFIAANF